jgi:hypothetical protein
VTSPVAAPTAFPTGVPPTAFPTTPKSNKPTDEPTPEPTRPPTNKPTDFPVTPPVPEPTRPPTNKPTDEPTPEPTPEPTRAPIEPAVEEPTPEPTPPPTNKPTPEATPEPTVLQTVSPTTCSKSSMETCVCGDEITVKFSDCEPQPEDWVGLYPCKGNATTYNYHPTMWLWTCFDKPCTAETALTQGELVFNKDTLPGYTEFGPHTYPLPPGCYVTILNRNFGLSPPPYDIVIEGEEFYV